MPDPKPTRSHRRRSGGEVRHQNSIDDDRIESGAAAKYESVPPEERTLASKAGPTMVRTIVVKDERGQIVSVTKIAPDARFGVGVKAQTGQVVTELETGSLAEDPFAAQQDK